MFLIGPPLSALVYSLLVLTALSAHNASQLGTFSNTITLQGAGVLLIIVAAITLSSYFFGLPSALAAYAALKFQQWKVNRVDVKAVCIAGAIAGLVAIFIFPFVVELFGQSMNFDPSERRPQETKLFFPYSWPAGSGEAGFAAFNCIVLLASSILGTLGAWWLAEER
jgi:hypothetical protein